VGWNYRCSDRNNCGVRRTLKHAIDWYKHRPKCKGCKRDTLKPVYRKERERSIRRGCFCQGMWWPHNKGRVEDERHVCEHADFAYVELTMELKDTFGEQVEVRAMKSDDGVPF